jgi:hypothetical protein
MADDKHNDDQNLLNKLIAALLRQSCLDVLGDVGRIIRRTVQGRSYRGLYEVLEYEATLELEDQGGKRATFKKREKVRYLQDNIIAYQDQAWGDGEIREAFHKLTVELYTSLPFDQWRFTLYPPPDVDT